MDMWPGRADDPGRWWAQTLGVTMLTIWSAFYVVTALLDEAKSPFEHALGIALGTVDPFESKGADFPAVILAVLSWLIVPTVIGTIAALVVEEQMRRARPLSADDRRKMFDEIKQELRREQKGGTDGRDYPGTGSGTE